MFVAFQVFAVLLAALSMTTALAHALELPGKLRLSKAEYLAIQPVYYPSFTIIGGIGELGSIPASAALAVMLPAGSTAAWLAWGACLSAIAVHVLYWAVVHPVNNFWLRESELGALGTGFFSIGGSRGDGDSDRWTAWRNRWEAGHVARSVFAVLALGLLATAIALG